MCRQDGLLVQLSDVRDLAAQSDILGALQELVGLGEIQVDLCVGGWPCNNLSGYNRAEGVHGRRGLDGSKSCLLLALSEIMQQLCAQVMIPVDIQFENEYSTGLIWHIAAVFRRAVRR